MHTKDTKTLVNFFKNDYDILGRDLNFCLNHYNPSSGKFGKDMPLLNIEPRTMAMLYPLIAQVQGRVMFFTQQREANKLGFDLHAIA